MLGAFQPTSINLAGLLWKSPWRMSRTRKMRARLRLKAVDQVIKVVTQAGVEISSLRKASALPTEPELLSKDKYTTFSRTDAGYRKSMHKVPKWTKLTSRTNPLGF